MDSSHDSRGYSSQSRHARSRRRSRSPARAPGHARSRDRSSSRNNHKRRRQRSSRAATAEPLTLPFKVQKLSKNDFEAFRPLFASYLDIQKHLVLNNLDESEVRGRWKSFIGKWNRGELAEGWYDPSVLRRATDNSQAHGRRIIRNDSPRTSREDMSSSEDEGPGPLLPQHLQDRHAHVLRAGPAIPSMQELELKKELAEEEAQSARSALRKDRRAHNTLEKQRLEELVPKAEAGTRERQLEKRKELAASNKSFAAAKEGGGVLEMADSDLIGGDEDDLAGFKKRKMEMEKQKSERELRREEISRAKREEREQRQREFREREDRTMQGFIELAKRRFG